MHAICLTQTVPEFYCSISCIILDLHNPEPTRTTKDQLLGGIRIRHQEKNVRGSLSRGVLVAKRDEKQKPTNIEIKGLTILVLIFLIFLFSSTRFLDLLCSSMLANCYVTDSSCQTYGRPIAHCDQKSYISASCRRIFRKGVGPPP